MQAGPGEQVIPFTGDKKDIGLQDHAFGQDHVKGGLYNNSSTVFQYKTFYLSGKVVCNMLVF